ncbi:hypothetical protein PIB30_097340 [Stylosanthes scabra]|uniref:Uncharacterized protein n=1 Tax=Stylosanthes scabra TaxID=79078 RepID=A0ABU6UYZ6_9FABA|nr:hypothetical protein [Stylosanthes scabra]
MRSEAFSPLSLFYSCIGEFLPPQRPTVCHMGNRRSLPRSHQLAQGNGELTTSLMARAKWRLALCNSFLASATWGPAFSETNSPVAAARCVQVWQRPYHPWQWRNGEGIHLSGGDDEMEDANLPNQNTKKTEDHFDSKKPRVKFKENAKTSHQKSRVRYYDKSVSDCIPVPFLFLKLIVGCCLLTFDEIRSDFLLLAEKKWERKVRLQGRQAAARMLLKQLFDRYDIYDNTIYSDAAAVKITTRKIGDALGLSSNGTAYDTRVVRKKLSQEDKDTQILPRQISCSTPKSDKINTARH